MYLDVLYLVCAPCLSFTINLWRRVFVADLHEPKPGGGGGAGPASTGRWVRPGRGGACHGHVGRCSHQLRRGKFPLAVVFLCKMYVRDVLIFCSCLVQNIFNRFVLLDMPRAFFFKHLAHHIHRWNNFQIVWRFQILSSFIYCMYLLLSIGSICLFLSCHWYHTSLIK